MTKKKTSDPLKRKRLTWQGNWGYREAFLIGFALITCGALLQFSHEGKTFPLPVFPGNAYMAAGFTALSLLFYIFAKNSAIFKFFAGIPAAIAALGSNLLLVFVMGIFVQDSSIDGALSDIGWRSMTNSWSFALTQIFLLFTLFCSCMKRLLPWKRCGIAFFLNHAGLYFTLLAALFGASDVSTVNIDLVGDSLVWEGSLQGSSPKNIDFALKLQKFSVDYYLPKIALIDNETGKVLEQEGEFMIEAQKGVQADLRGWAFQVDEYLPEALRAGENYYFVNETGTTPAASLSVKGPQGQILRGWVACGSFRAPYKSIKLCEEFSLVMTNPEPKVYSSQIKLFSQNKESQEITLEVNQPMQWQGWTLYLLSFNERLGRDAKSVVVQAVRDPWLPFVYCGIFMMLAGSVLLIFIHPRTASKKEDIA